MSNQKRKPSSLNSGEIVLVGDSQAVLWLGSVIGEYFSEFQENCSNTQAPYRERVSGLYGYATGSSSFRHWISRSGEDHNHMCGSRGHSALIVNGNKEGGLRFNQSAPEICTARRPVQGVFQRHPNPSLVIVNFLGNSAWDSIRVRGRRVNVPWSSDGVNLSDEARSIEYDLERQVSEFLSYIPAGAACIVLTTSPNRLDPSVQRQRIHAQAVIRRAVSNSGRCSFVSGITPEINAVFRLNPNFLGDRFHISTEGARWWLNTLNPEICGAAREARQRVQ